LRLLMKFESCFLFSSVKSADNSSLLFRVVISRVGCAARNSLACSNGLF
jgi:hypothetical protein